jgi:hypothetical protein
MTSDSRVDKKGIKAPFLKTSVSAGKVFILNSCHK